MCQSGATCLSVDCSFSNKKKNPTKHVGLVQSGSHRVKARLYLIDFKFPTKHAGCHFSLISDIAPSIPIYLFQRRRFFKISQSETRIVCGGHVC
jgi:hypothetical protein